MEGAKQMIRTVYGFGLKSQLGISGRPPACCEDAEDLKAATNNNYWFNMHWALWSTSHCDTSICYFTLGSNRINDIQHFTKSDQKQIDNKQM